MRCDKVLLRRLQKCDWKMHLSARGAFFLRKNAFVRARRIFCAKKCDWDCQSHFSSKKMRLGCQIAKKMRLGCAIAKKCVWAVQSQKKCVWTAQSPKEMRLSCTLVKSPGAFCRRCISVVIFAASNRILIALHFWITFFDISNRIFFNIAFSIAFLTSSNRIFQNIAFSIAFSYSSNHIFSINAFSIAFFGSHLV